MRNDLIMDEQNGRHRDNVINNNFNHYTLPASPIITINVESKKEFEKMFPAVDVDYEKYIDEFKEFF